MLRILALAEAHGLPAIGADRLPGRVKAAEVDAAEFVETAAVEAARRRMAQEAFLARGRASPAKAKRAGEFYAADKVLDDMRERVQSRMQALRKSDGTPGANR